MPQLDTSTWFTIMSSSSLTLFMLIQLKIHSHNFPPNPMSKNLTTKSPKLPWELKWTKTYSLPSLPQQ